MIYISLQKTRSYPSKHSHICYSPKQVYQTNFAKVAVEKKINLSKAIVEGTLSVTNLVASIHVWTQYKIVSVKWYEVFIWFIFAKIQVIYQMQSACRCSGHLWDAALQPLWNMLQHFTVLQRAACEEKYYIQLKLSQENRNYLFESLSFRCYQLSMMAHFTLRELMSLKSQRERNHCLTCQHHFKLYA